MESIPHGKHKGKYIEHLPNMIVNALFQSWGSGSLKYDPFFPRIHHEMQVRDLLDKDGQPKNKIDFQKLSLERKAKKKPNAEARAFAKKFACPTGDNEVIPDDGLGLPFTTGRMWKDRNGAYIYYGDD